MSHKPEQMQHSWTKIYCGVTHLNGLKYGWQVTCAQYSKAATLQIYYRGKDEGHSTTIAAEWADNLPEAQQTAIQLAQKLHAFENMGEELKVGL